MFQSYIYHFSIDSFFIFFTQTVSETLTNVMLEYQKRKKHNMHVKANVEDEKERKELLMSQFELFANQKDCPIIVPALLCKIETATRLIEEYTFEWSTSATECVRFVQNIKGLKSRKKKLQEKLMDRIHLCEKKLEILTIRLFTQFQLE